MKNLILISVLFMLGQQCFAFEKTYYPDHHRKETQRSSYEWYEKYEVDRSTHMTTLETGPRVVQTHHDRYNNIKIHIDENGKIRF